MQEAPASPTVSSVNMMMVDRLLGCLTHVFDVVRFSILRRSTHMTREEILQAIEDLTAQIRTLSYSSSKEAAAQRADL